jgi:hypothetical protein
MQMLFWVFEKLGHLVLPTQVMILFWVFDQLGLLQQRISIGKSLEQASVWVDARLFLHTYLHGKLFCA